MSDPVKHMKELLDGMDAAGMRSGFKINHTTGCELWAGAKQLLTEIQRLEGEVEALTRNNDEKIAHIKAAYEKIGDLEASLADTMELYRGAIQTVRTRDARIAELEKQLEPKPEPPHECPICHNDTCTSDHK